MKEVFDYLRSDNKKKAFLLLKTDRISVLEVEDDVLPIEKEKALLSANTIDTVHFCDPLHLIDRFISGHLFGVIDDVGKMKKLPFNPYASLIYAPNQDFIAGDVLLGWDVGSNPFEPDMYAFPHDLALDLKDHFEKLRSEMVEEVS